MSRGSETTTALGDGLSLRGKYVALIGRLASMSSDELEEIVEAHGATLNYAPARGTAYIVVGQRDWPLQRDGRLLYQLRRARVLKEREHYTARIVSEDEFLKMLGLEDRREATQHLFSASTLAELLEVAPNRIRAWVAAGLIKPVRIDQAVQYFDFAQVSAAKTLCELTRAGITSGRIRRSLEQLRAWMPEAELPLQQLSVLEKSGPLVVRLEQGDLAAADGQLFLDFEGDAPQPIRLFPAAPTTAAQWTQLAREQEEAGSLREAAHSFGEALLAGGPTAELCYDLANVLTSIGETERAIERYRQATELDPQMVDAWNNLGVALCSGGRHDEGCAAFERALTIDPADARANYNVADALDETGRGREAVAYWRAYLRSDTSSERAAYARRRMARWA